MVAICAHYGILVHVFLHVLVICQASSMDLRGASPEFLRRLGEDPWHYACVPRDRMDVPVAARPPETFPISILNDDYCDCVDGSDEPGTSACANGHFHCRNEGSQAKVIPSSWVNDGVCDCCDGSDEWWMESEKNMKRDPQGKVCPNGCEEEMRKREAEEEAVEARKRSGLAAKAEMVAEGKRAMEKLKKDMEQWKEELEAKKRKKTELSTRLARLRKIMEYVGKGPAGVRKEAVSEEKAQEGSVRDERRDHDEGVDDERDDHWDDDEDDDDDGDDDVHEPEDYDYDHEDEEVEKEIDESISEDEGEDEESDEILSGDESSGAASAPDGEAEPTAESSSETPRMDPISPVEEERIISSTPAEAFVAQTLRASAKPPSTASDSSCLELLGEPGSLLDVFKDKLLRIIRRGGGSSSWSAEDRREFADKCIQFLEGKERLLSSSIRDLEKKISQEKSRVDLKEPALFAMAGRCFKKKASQYDFEHCPFESVKQYENGRMIATLGSFEGWKEGTPLAMKYGGGAKCWQGPSRSTTVELICGEVNEIIAVDEPEKCTYVMKFSTPSACQETEAETSGSEDEQEEL